ncbi:hypothetical protein CROQUDRAFT_663636 [Cronartium quercuum f. sp. fusiforme G11]|uniref:C3H1-type domain-containing protein n=1 Tax=Cronartium quercuum f. sp. fusiforme G11 TaxID=708437 RepID=A0A9P6N814_9BASI|nr:hypothetical protein CROQUDRAFT_663636 [Cronartium quercuum f. sp. fusiforme G11]
MSAEQAVIRAEMDRLQGTINQRKKTITEVQNTSIINRPTQSQITRQLSSTSVWATAPPNARVHDIASRARPAPALAQSPRLSFPLVTKTSWKLARSSNVSHSLSARGTGSKKLVLNKPAIMSAKSAHTLPPIDHTPLILNSFAAPSCPSSLPTPQTTPYINSSNLQQVDHPSPPKLPSLSPARTCFQPSQAVVAETKSTFKKMTLSASSKPFVPGASKSSVSTPAQSIMNAPSNEVFIGGILFARDPGGKKLVRSTNNAVLPQKGSVQVPLVSAQAESSSTPLKASVAGTTYVRTKSGNLIALSALKKHQAQKLQDIKKARLMALTGGLRTKYTAQGAARTLTWNPRIGRGRGSMSMKISRPPSLKKNEQCRFFAKTGACRKGLTCVYQHEPSNVAICPRFLRRTCPNPTSACPLSHKPNPHNMEHCSHFPRCNKPNCPYPHVTIHTSNVCKDFAELGWCVKGAECSDRHVRECPEFTEKGTCSNANCRLPHVINRGKKADGQHDESESDQEHPHSAGVLFFTDVKGKRKADSHDDGDELDHRMPLRAGPRSSKEDECDPILTTSNRTGFNKRVRYDQVANNEDFVTFGSSDENADGSQHASGESDGNLEPDDEVASSVDSDELHSVIMDEALDVEFEPSAIAQLDNAVVYAPTSPRMPISKIRRRSDLEEGEEVEEGEIFEDEKEEEDVDCESSEDDDERIARQLLGHRRPYKS